MVSMALFADAVARAKPLQLRWSILGAGVGIVLGAATAVNTTLGVGLAITIGVVVAILMRPSSLLMVLVASVFVELIKIGSVTITRLIAPVALFVVIAAAVRKGTQIRPAPPLFFAGAYALWALASGLWTLSPAGTTYLLSSLAIALVFMLAFASLLATQKDLERVLYALAVLSLALGVLSTFAFIGRPLFGFGLLQEGRVQGGTGDPSFFAAAQLIALPLILVLASNAKKGLLRNALYLVALVNIGSVLSTVSRGGTIQLLVVLVLLLALPARTIFSSPAQKRVAMAALVAGMAVFFVHYSADLAPRLETIYSRSSDKTASGRLAIWPAAIDAFNERPFLGVGYGAFVRTSVDRIFSTPGSNIENFNVHPEEVHNVFLGTATELGIPGLAIFLGLLLSTGLALRRTARRAREAGALFISSVANALIIGLVGWCAGSMFIETETSRPLWILIGMTLALPKLIPDAEEPEPQ
jgi:putative inorganic carbon (HCO3(-)) transporter